MAIKNKLYAAKKYVVCQGLKYTKDVSELYAFGKSGSNCHLLRAQFSVQAENRLLFETGIYMGFGLRLIFYGTHEALK